MKNSYIILYLLLFCLLPCAQEARAASTSFCGISATVVSSLTAGTMFYHWYSLTQDQARVTPNVTLEAELAFPPPPPPLSFMEEYGYLPVWMIMSTNDTESVISYCWGTDLCALTIVPEPEVIEEVKDIQNNQFALVVMPQPHPPANILVRAIVCGSFSLFIAAGLCGFLINIAGIVWLYSLSKSQEIQQNKERQKVGELVSAAAQGFLRRKKYQQYLDSIVLLQSAIRRKNASIISARLKREQQEQQECEHDARVQKLELARQQEAQAKAESFARQLEQERREREAQMQRNIEANRAKITADLQEKERIKNETLDLQKRQFKTNVAPVVQVLISKICLICYVLLGNHLQREFEDRELEKRWKDLSFKQYMHISRLLSMKNDATNIDNFDQEGKYDFEIKRIQKLDPFEFAEDQSRMEAINLRINKLQTIEKISNNKLRMTHEERIMHTRLSSLGLYEIAVADNGNCFFDSVLLQLRNCERTSPMNMRKMVANWILANKNFVDENGFTIADIVEEDIDSYCTKLVSSSQFYATTPCFTAICHLFQAKIYFVRAEFTKNISDKLYFVDALSCPNPKRTFILSFRGKHFNPCFVGIKPQPIHHVDLSEDMDLKKKCSGCSRNCWIWERLCPRCAHYSFSDALDLSLVFPRQLSSEQKKVIEEMREALEDTQRRATEADEASCAASGSGGQ